MIRAQEGGLHFCLRGSLATYGTAWATCGEGCAVSTMMCRGTGRLPGSPGATGRLRGATPALCQQLQVCMPPGGEGLSADLPCPRSVP